MKHNLISLILDIVSSACVIDEEEMSNYPSVVNNSQNKDFYIKITKNKPFIAGNIDPDLYLCTNLTNTNLNKYSCRTLTGILLYIFFSLN